MKELKDNDQKKEKDMVEIKSMINGLTHQHNEMRSQMVNRESGKHSKSILGHSVSPRG